MSELIVRRLMIDLKTPVARHWCNNDAFQTAFFNALSLSFPLGEQIFIDSLKKGVATLPKEQQDAMHDELQQFVGQEATHRHIHSLFNEHLIKQGLINNWSKRSIKRMDFLAKKEAPASHYVALTAAYEHFTAVFSTWLLSQPDFFHGTEDRLKTMWQWHSAEENEHKNVAFDVYKAMGNEYSLRITWFKRVCFLFLSDLLRQTTYNLYRDKSLFKIRTWVSAYHILIGKNGFLRTTWPALLAFKKPDFHPSQDKTLYSSEWLAANSGAFKEIVRAV